MKVKLLMIGILIFAVPILGLTGCGAADAQTPVPSSSASATSGSLPVNVSVSNQQGIWVSGQGDVKVSPDISTIDLGVSVQAAKVADAQSQAAADMTKVITALTDNGVDQKDISTRYYNISPITKYDNTTQQSTITGYQVSNMVNVTVRSIDKVGVIIDAVTVAGGDATRINSINFSISNPDQYYSQARTLAVNDAKAKAQQLASLAGVTLGNPFYIIENPASTPVPITAMAPTIAPSINVTTPINPGQTDIIVNIQVGYAIK